MATKAFDYVREVNQFSEELLRCHGELLARKNITRKPELLKLIKLDLDKLTHALVEVKDTRASAVLRNFFDGSALAESACERLAEDYVYHVGFEVHEPLGLVLYGIVHWIEHSNEALDAEMHIVDFLKFPASPAFQKRVGAYAEIMRIWLQVHARVLMLELFDIHRPVDSVLAAAPRPTHRNFHGLFRSEDDVLEGHDERLTKLFGSDEIWHYALHVRKPADVEVLHGELRGLAARDSGYFLPYASPVYNQHDGSYHTKVVRHGGSERCRLELEFVTQKSEALAAVG